MKVNKSYISNNNTYAGNSPRFLIIHNTDNFNAGANALAHAKAQYNGNFKSMSAHYYVDDGDAVYQSAPHSRGCWHVGVNYGGRLFGAVNNKNSIGVEMCVQRRYNFNKAFNNTVELVKQLMIELDIPADRVLQHYDVCSKNCPSQIRAIGKWDEFKARISNSSTSSTCSTSSRVSVKTEVPYTPGLYKVKVDTLNIRSGPSISSRVIGTITDKGTYTITEIKNDSWGRLKSGKGWINCSTAYCEKRKLRDSSKTKDAYTPGLYKVKVDTLNIRSGPSISNRVVGTITDMGTYTLTEIQNGSWGQLKSGKGWINCSTSYCEKR